MGLFIRVCHWTDLREVVSQLQSLHPGMSHPVLRLPYLWLCLRALIKKKQKPTNVK